MDPLPAGAPTRFDALLAVIGVCLVGGFVASAVSSLSLATTGAVSSLLACVGLLDGLVRNPPVED